MELAPNLRADAFAGTAIAYLRYRPPYPVSLLADLLARANPSDHSLLLDLASGPGRLALDLAAAFEQVRAIDLEPEMIAVGRREAERRGIGNIKWLVSRAEDAAISPNSIDLITIGDAFHRLDQKVIAQRALVWLKPGGSIALLGTDGLLTGGEVWKETVAEVARRWMARAFPEGWAVSRAGAELGPAGAERVLRQTGFADVESRAFVQPRDWSFEEIAGNLRSTSVCSNKALGEHVEAFEADLRRALGGESGGVFHEALRCGYTIGRRPT
jgi:ubiquinone/menaquinone biosynthesis C-methylase UbiE